MVDTEFITARIDEIKAANKADSTRPRKPLGKRLLSITTNVLFDSSGDTCRGRART